MVAVVSFIWISGSAFADDWQFYGTVSVNTFWADSDLDKNTQYSQALNPGANIGAEIKILDAVSGAFEYGTEDGNANIVNLFGEWDFGGGSLLVGQAETPANQGIAGQVWDDDRALDGLGEFNPGERAQIRLAVGDLEIAAVQPNTQVRLAAGATDDGTDTEVKFPNIQVRYAFDNDAFDAGVSAAYGRFDYKDKDVTSYVALASMGVTVNRLRLAAQGWLGQNIGNIAAQDTRGDDDNDDGFAIYENGAIHDVDAWGVALVAQLALNDMIAFEAGYGHVDLDYGDTTVFSETSDKAQSYYLNMTITLAEGVQVVPEIGVVDYNESGQDEITYGGAKWQIEF